MGFAAYRAWTTGTQSFSPHVEDLARKGATLYTVQLGLNLIWMPLFFKFKRPIEATVDIVALTGITGYMAYLWGQVDQVAGWALAPYCGWLCFATYLCVSIWDPAENKGVANRGFDRRVLDILMAGISRTRSALCLRR